MRHGQAQGAARGGVVWGTGAACPMSPSTREELEEEVVVEAPRNGGPRRGPRGVFLSLLLSFRSCCVLYMVT
jgi:hypothetical protein